MKNNISADTLFHFMKRKIYLKDVLLKNFYPRYCKENLQELYREDVYIAMKCFCDIPLSAIGEHCKFYGKYGIGFKKSWGIKIGVNPIQYINYDSKYFSYMRNAYNSTIDAINKIEELLLKEECEESRYDLCEESTFNELASVRRDLRSSFMNYKPLKGKMRRKSKEVQKNFYDEREWRYIMESFLELRSDKTPDLEPLILESSLRNFKISDCNDLLQKNNKIEYDYTDINYILVKNEKDVVDICNFIDKKLKISKDEKEILKTKIINYSDMENNI